LPAERGGKENKGKGGRGKEARRVKRGKSKVEKVRA
jgi:hypothetical protein